MPEASKGCGRSVSQIPKFYTVKIIFFMTVIHPEKVSIVWLGIISCLTWVIWLYWGVYLSHLTDISTFSEWKQSIIDRKSGLGHWWFTRSTNGLSWVLYDKYCILLSVILLSRQQSYDWINKNTVIQVTNTSGCQFTSNLRYLELWIWSRIFGQIVFFAVKTFQLLYS